LPIAVADADIKSDESGRGALSTIIEPKYAQQTH
jgi:sulfonate transport system substrate-binding protein